MGRLVHDRFDRLLVLVFAPVIGAFLIGVIAVQINSWQVRDLGDELDREVMPRMERLVLLRRSVDDAELALSRYVHSAGAERASAELVLDAALGDLTRSFLTWSQVAPTADIDQPLVRRLELTLSRFRDSVARTRRLAVTDEEAAEKMLGNVVIDAANDVTDAASAQLEISSAQGQKLAREILSVRGRTAVLSFALATLCVGLAVVGAFVIRADRRQRRERSELDARRQQARVDELEQFSGRLAHDIRNPLSTALLAAELLHGGAREPQTRELAERIERSLGRAAAITEGLLEFARAGGRPDPGARTDVREVVRDIVADLAPEAERARVELAASPVPPVSVACSSGVYLSMLSNVVRNALKYMGDAVERKITLRVRERGGWVRTEVIDTGPGIAPELVKSIFEPYIRGPSYGQRGLGLGLATVKRLAEGHGGSVGVISKPGAGSTFWFELASAGPVDVLDHEPREEPYAGLSH